MEDIGLCYMPATALAAAIRAKRLSPVEVVDAVLARIERLNPSLNAYCTVTAEAARASARAAEAAVMGGGPLGPLHGVPVSIKDLVITKGIRTTWGSKIHEHVVPEEDAPLVERLKAAGAIILGKTNTPEYGWTAETDNRVFGPTRNPWDGARSAGGSSGGAGAAVAAGLGPLAVGTDGGGSIRIPGAFCGIFGFKPSFGRVPVYPASAAETLTHAGPMARTVRDAAVMLAVMAGPDERDRNSLPADGADYPGALGDGIRGLHVAWSPDLGYALVDPAVRGSCAAAARAFEGIGCRVEEASPGFADPSEAWSTLFYGAIAARLGPYLPQWRDRMDPGLVPLVEKGQGFTGVQFAEAGFRRAALWDGVRRFFGIYDLMLTPTVAVPPLPLGQTEDIEIAGRRVPRWQAFPFNLPFNLTGQPAATVPCGWTETGLPIGLQIVGRRFADATVLKAAAAFEAARPWEGRRPPLG
ncbi:MAG TPA: amidase [Candidatus Sulfotelmatobacter sp.]|nr:amidase [Candidatus Sulfotelmatobacter sp.]